MSERVRQEVRIHARLKHPAIVELISFFEDASYVYLVLELCGQGELKQYCPLRDEDEARRYMAQVVEGVQYLHTHGIMHRDLKLENMLVTDAGVVVGC